jgi:Na+/melibiose symporter-like transporter
MTANPPYRCYRGMFLFGAVGMTASSVNYLFKYNLHASPRPFALLADAFLFIPCTCCANRTSSDCLVRMGILAAVLTACISSANAASGSPSAFSWWAASECRRSFCPWAMIDTVEYSQWKLGVRREASCSAPSFFFSSSARWLFLQGMGLHLAATWPMRASALTDGIRLLVSLVPWFVLAGSLFLFPNGRKARKIVQEIYGLEPENH